MEKEILPQFEYLFVLDFEATCVEDKKIEPCPEIIEFPIIVVHLPTGKKIDQFHHYVKPRFNPKLTKFCTDLTGITQQMVDGGHQIQIVLEKLEEWFNSLKYLKAENFVFITCGDWDLSNCLKNEAKNKKLSIRPYLRNYINIKKYFDKVVGFQGKRVSGMMAMISFLGLKHEGRHHSGIDDVTNICNVCIQLAHKHKATFPKQQVNKVRYYQAAQESKAEFEYLLVLDFEATCIRDKKIHPCPEIIEFPVVIVNTLKKEKVGVFHHYVKPRLNPQLSQFCTQLTGITQQMVQKGSTIEETLQKFEKWLSEHSYIKPHNSVIITCGDWDLGTCLRLQSQYKQLKLPEVFRRYINIKKYFFKVVKVREKVNGMMDMLKVLSIPHEGRHHSGIDDVQNIANICIELLLHHKAMFPQREVVNLLN